MGGQLGENDKDTRCLYPKTSLFVRKLDVTDDNNGQDNHADEDLDDEGWVGGYNKDTRCLATK